jgi:hypothetical protein
MQLLKLNKKTGSRVEQYRKVVSIYCLLNNIVLSNSELDIMSYYICYGINDSTKELILNSNIVKSVLVLKNINSSLKKSGLLTKDYKNKRDGMYYITNDLLFNNEPIVGIMIKLDNT